MKWNFAKNAWTEDAITHAYNYRFPQTPVFQQYGGYIENPPEPTMSDGYSYISLISRKKYTPVVRISTHCAFEGNAAPLIVLVKDLFDDDGVLHYGDYLEVVLWKNGLNVWKLWMQEDRTVKWHKLLGINMPVQPGTTHALSVQVTSDSLEISLDGFQASLRTADIFPSFHLGITGCEGISRFYDMEIQEL